MELKYISWSSRYRTFEAKARSSRIGTWPSRCQNANITQLEYKGYSYIENIYDNNVDIDEENIDVKTPFGRLLSSVSVGSSTESLKLLLNFIVLMFRAAMITCKKINISDIFCWQNEWWIGQLYLFQKVIIYICFSESYFTK